MSATGRAGSKRQSGDHYATPAWVTRLILPRVKEACAKCSRWIIEPSAGTGSILRTMIEDGFDPESMVAIESNSDRAESLCSLDSRVQVFPLDFFSASARSKINGLDNRPRLFIGNPPYSEAQRFAEQAIELMGEGGLVVLLLRLGFLESQKRAPFNRKHPAHVHILETRPSFLEGSGTDATAYGWFVWGDRKPGRWEILLGGPERKSKPKGGKRS